MKFHETTLSDVLVVEPHVHEDKRGYFMETWRKEWFANFGNAYDFVQDNQSKSCKGTLRGLHYQLTRPQGKYVRVLKGEIFDVAVDLRESSSSYGNWAGVTLSAKNKLGLWVPPGFAHGFLVTSEEAEICYKCTDYYAPDDEHCLAWDDPEVGIQWPVEDMAILMSDKDRTGKPFSVCSKFP